jgi:hypothetical protein
MGKGERSRAETQAHNISSRQEEDRSRTAGKVGEGEGGEEVGVERAEPAAAMRQAFMFEVNCSTPCVAAVEVVSEMVMLR